MREILFRGKRVRDGEWVFGSFVSPNMITAPMGEEIYGSDVVTRESVGQYTGLKDKNGNKIFEGDIFVSYEYGDKKYDLIGVIERRGASFILRSENYEDSQLNDYVEGTITHYKPNGERIVLESDIVQGEVIGTIYDNPELLEVEK